MTKQEITIQWTGERYFSPATKVITVNATRILCGSERENALNTTEMEEGDDNW